MEFPLSMKRQDFFPAYAGVILEPARLLSVFRAFPRTRGGDPGGTASAMQAPKLFPAYAGVIPAG